MKEKKVIVYEGEVIDGWEGIWLGDDLIASICGKLESFLGSGRKIKVKIEYDEDALQPLQLTNNKEVYL